MAAGYCCIDEMMDASAVGREPPREALIAERPGWSRAFRKILDSKAPPIGPKVEATSFEEVEIHAVLEARDILSGAEDRRSTCSLRRLAMG